MRAKRIDDNYFDKEVVITYLYDTNGIVYGFKSSDEKYPFIYKKNQQGDVISIVSSETGNTVLNYYYDAWGNVKLGYPSQNNTDIEFANKIAKYNDFTYRSYCFDIETGLYYLHNRYYSPSLSRFISADKYCSTEISPLGFNMYLYCQNNPVNNIDENGTSQTSIMSTALGRGLGLYDDPEDKDAKGFLGFTHLGDSVLTWTSKPWTTVINGWQSNFGYSDLYDYTAPLFVDGIDKKKSTGYNETIVLYNKSANNTQTEPTGSVLVFWSTEEIPEGFPPKINLFDLLYRLIVTYD